MKAANPFTWSRVWGRPPLMIEIFPPVYESEQTGLGWAGLGWAAKYGLIISTARARVRPWSSV